METYKIIVTGEHDGDKRLPTEIDGKRIEWKSVPVLEFEKLSVDPDLVARLTHKPVEWIIFTSQRSVHFWSEVLLAHGVDFPIETQVACIGEHTAEVASQDGFNPDFYPTEPGTEVFLEEFGDMIGNNSKKPSVFIPQAEGGRTTIRDRLSKMGCEVTSISLYRSKPRKDLARFVTKEDVEQSTLILFTSPSSVDAFTKAFTVPSHVKVASIGRYTATHLLNKGFSDQKMLPDGDFQRIGELLC